MDRRQTGQLPDQILEIAVGNTFTESLPQHFKELFFFSSSNTTFSIYHYTSVLSVPLFSWQRSFQGQKKSSAKFGSKEAEYEISCTWMNNKTAQPSQTCCISMHITYASKNLHAFKSPYSLCPHIKRAPDNLHSIQGRSRI